MLGIEKETFQIGYDFDRPIERMIEAGQYGWSDPDLANPGHGFSIKGHGKGVIAVVLFHFIGANKVVTSRQAITEMKKDDSIRLPMIEDLLALGEVHPGLQEKIPIAALRPDNHFIPYLGWRKRYGRIASFFWTGDFWGPAWRRC